MTLYVFTVEIINTKGNSYREGPGITGRRRFKKSLKFKARELGSAIEQLDHHCMNTMGFDEYYVLYIFSEPIPEINWGDVARLFKNDLP